MAMNPDSLKHFYGSNTRPDDLLLLKNLPDTASEDLLTNYIEVLGKPSLTVTSVWVDEHCPGIALVKIDRSISGSGVTGLQDAARGKPLKGKTAQVTLLGRATGVCFCLPISTSAVSTELIGLYFENNKLSGGQESCVESSKVTRIHLGHHVVVHIQNETALKDILGFGQHTLYNTEVKVEPYFPSLHDYIINKLKIQNTTNSGNKATDSHKPSHSINAAANVKPMPSPKPLHLTKPTAAAPQPLENTPRNPNKIYERQQSLEDILIPGCFRQTQSPAQGSTNSDPVPSSILGPPQTARSNYGSSKGASSLSLAPCLALYPPQVPANYDSPISSNNAATNSASNVHSVPSARLGKSSSSSSMKRNPDRLSLTVVREVQLSPEEMQLIIFSKFCSKYNSETCKAEGKDNLVIRATSESLIDEMERKLKEHLTKVVKEVKRFDEAACRYLSNSGSKKCLRDKFKNKKINAVVTVDESSSTVTCSGFSISSIESAFKYLDDSMITRTILLRPGQLDMKFSDYKNLTGTYRIDKQVHIVSFFEDNCRQAFNRIMKSLRERWAANSRLEKSGSERKESRANQPSVNQQVIPDQRKAVVRLTGGRARCYKQWIHQSLSRELRKSKGEVDYEQIGTESSIELRVQVIGSDEHFLQLRQYIDSIEEMELDIRRFCKDEEDRQLVWQGLLSDNGKSVLRHCETELKCFIIITKHGQPRPPTVELITSSDSTDMSQFTINSSSDIDDDDDDDVKKFLMGDENKSADIIKDIATMIGSDSEGADDDGSGASVESDDEMEQARLAKKQAVFNETKADSQRRYNQYKYQSGLSEKEAIQLALQQSLETDQQEPVRSPAVQQLVPYHRNREQMRMTNAYTPSTPQSLSKPFYDHNSIKQPSQPQLARLNTPQLHPYVKLQRLHARGVVPPRVISVTGGLENVDIQHGAIAEYQSDVLVNLVAPDMTLSTVVAKSFIQIFGQDFQDHYEQVMVLSSPPNQDKCFVLETQVTGTQGMWSGNSQTVINVRLAKRQQGNSGLQRQNIKDAMEKILAQCDTGDYSTLALLPLGTGRMYGYNSTEVAYEMLNCLFRYFQQTATCLQMVTIVIYDQKEYQVFTDAYGKFSRQKAMQPIQSRDTQVSQSYAKGHSSQSPFNQVKQRRSLSTMNEPLYQHAEKQKQSSNKAAGKRSHAASVRHQQRVDQRTHLISGKKVLVYFDKSSSTNPTEAVARKLKDEFLFEKKSKRRTLTKQTIKEIARLTEKHKIRTIPEKDSFVLRGHKDKVQKVYEDILKLMLEDPAAKQHVRRSRKKQIPRKTQEYVRYMAEEEEHVPEYWSKHNGESITSVLLSLLSIKEYSKVKLQQSDKCYTAIQDVFRSTFDPTRIGQGSDAVGLNLLGYTKLQVLKIERIENIKRYRDYYQKRRAMFQTLLHSGGKVEWPHVKDLPNSTGDIETEPLKKTLSADINSEVNEIFVFHGAKKEFIDKICDDGLDPRIGSANAMFGSGVYGAEKSSKADQYTDDKTSRSKGKKKMFLVRMLLGNPFLCSQQNPKKYNRPPCCRCQEDKCSCKKSPRYDSVVGDNNKLFREFVVYSGDQCYPEYLITYERV